MSSRFARGALVVLAAVPLSAACGGKLDSSSLDGGADSPPPTASPPSRRPPKRPTPPPEEEGICPAPVDFDRQSFEDVIGGTYRPPAPPAAACTDGQIQTFEHNLLIADSFESLREGLPDACAECIFTNVRDVVWGPIVVIDARGAQGFVNVGGCHAAVNGDTACGEAVQYEQFCAAQACADCASDAEAEACFGEAQSGTCNGLYGAIVSSCPKLAESTKACGGSITTLVRTFCAP